MFKLFLTVTLLVLVMSVSGQKKGTANLSISISNINLDGGKLFVGLYNNKNSFKLKQGATDSVIIIPNKTTITVKLVNIPYGDYAIAAFQDINGNGKLDSREFNIPTEPVGISNYCATKLKLPPTFKNAKFNISSDTLLLIPLVFKK